MRLSIADRVVADEEAQAAGEPQPGQRRDERLDLEVRDEEAHHRADRHAHDAASAGSPATGPMPPRSSGRGGDGRQGDDAADRQVDAAREDDERHPDRADQQERRGPEQVEEDLRVAHRVVGNGAERSRRAQNSRIVAASGMKPDGSVASAGPDRASRLRLPSGRCGGQPPEADPQPGRTAAGSTTITTAPLTAMRALAGTPSAYIEVVIACMTSAPMTLRQQREAAAGQERAADDDREDRVELVVQADLVGVRRPDVRRWRRARRSRRRSRRTCRRTA